jgi:hypothetical protein
MYVCTYVAPTITVNDQTLNVVDRFTYLGSTLSQAVHIDNEINIRIARASSALGRLRENVWDRREIQLLTKLKVYKEVVLPSLLYSCETWPIYSRHSRQLNHFHLVCLRKLLKIRCQDKIPATEVLESAGMSSVYTILRKSQLRWAGHVVRMPEELLPKKIF